MPTPFPDIKVEWDHIHNEPYLPIIGHPGLTITPIRETDAEKVIELSNLPEIRRWSYNRPVPYTSTHFREFYDRLTQSSAAALAVLADDPTAVVDFAPFEIIRDAQGSAIGSVGIFVEGGVMRPIRGQTNRDAEGEEGKTDDDEKDDEKQGKQGKQVDQGKEDEDGENSAQQGNGGHHDPSWVMGYSLLPAYHRQGITSAAVLTLLGWARQGVAAKSVTAGIEPANAASTGLAVKLGFKQYGSKQMEWPKDKGGGVREMAFWRVEL